MTLIPAALIQLEFESGPRDCIPEASTEMTPDRDSTPLLSADETYFVDGSRYSMQDSQLSNRTVKILWL